MPAGLGGNGRMLRALVEEAGALAEVVCSKQSLCR